MPLIARAIRAKLLVMADPANLLPASAPEMTPTGLIAAQKARLREAAAAMAKRKAVRHART